MLTIPIVFNHTQAKHTTVLRHLDTTSSKIIAKATAIEAKTDSSVNGRLDLLQNVEQQISQLPITIESRILEYFERYGKRLQRLRAESRDRALEQSNEISQLVRGPMHTCCTRGRRNPTVV